MAEGSERRAGPDSGDRYDVSVGVEAENDVGAAANALQDARGFGSRVGAGEVESYLPRGESAAYERISVRELSSSR